MQLHIRLFAQYAVNAYTTVLHQGAHKHGRYAKRSTCYSPGMNYIVYTHTLWPFFKEFVQKVQVIFQESALRFDMQIRVIFLLKVMNSIIQNNKFDEIELVITDLFMLLRLARQCVARLGLNDGAKLWISFKLFSKQSSSYRTSQRFVIRIKSYAKSTRNSQKI